MGVGKLDFAFNLKLIKAAFAAAVAEELPFGLAHFSEGFFLPELGLNRGVLLKAVFRVVVRLKGIIGVLAH